MTSLLDLHHGDCLEVLASLPCACVDAIVTDPPYGLSFMGRKWDYDVPATEIWEQCLRVLKPGGHLLAFAGTRTQHRMAVNIEDAGFEIRDMIAWVYGSGFPKSMDVSKAIDKAGGAAMMHIEERKSLATEIRAKRQQAGVSRAELASWFPQYSTVTANWERADSGFRVPTEDAYTVLVERLGLDKKWRDLVRAEDQRRLVRDGLQDRRDDGTVIGLGHSGKEWVATTEEAQQWDGWGTALKPALEPITVARKPIKGTVAQNVLEHGTGAINIDGCRVGTEQIKVNGWKCGGEQVYNGRQSEGFDGGTHQGRWPANVIHDGSDKPCGLLGDAARFFYCAKASKADREDGNSHPTVKPTDLMAYLCRLVTPPGGIVLDPFMGSGTTGKAALSEGFGFIGIERDAEYYAICESRFNGAQIGLPLGV